MARDVILNHSWIRARLLDQAEVALGVRPHWRGELRLEWTADENPALRQSPPGSLAWRASRFTVVIGAGELPNPPGFSDHPFLSWGVLRLTMQGSALETLWRTADWHIRDLQIEDLKIHGERDVSGTGNWQVLLPLEGQASASQLQIDRIELRRASFSYQQIGNDQISLVTQLVELNQLQRTTTDLWRIKDLVLTTQDLGQWELNDFSLAIQETSADSFVIDAMTRWRIQNLALRKLPLPARIPAWIDETEAPLVITEAQGKLQPLRTSSTQLSHVDALLQIDTLQLDDTHLQGIVRFTPATLDVRLDFGELTLDSFIPRSKQGFAASDEPLRELLPWSTLRRLGLRGVVHIDELRWGPDRLRGVALEISP